MNTAFPFSAIVGQDQLKLCLALAAVDWRLSCLIRGDKGSGKSTAARGLAGVLPGSAPFINVPIGVTEDRLLGGLSLEKAFEGKAVLRAGLVDEASGGVLYIDEVNLLAGHLTDALLDVSATGRYVLERDGFSQSYDARFVLMGSMNLEEGSLRPQLLDRFALALDVHAPSDPSERIAVILARQRFDDDPGSFRRQTEKEQDLWRESIAMAREAAPRVTMDEALLLQISQAITSAGVRSLRADLAALRAATALAALEGRLQVEQADIDRVLPLVLLHRADPSTPSSPPVAPPAPDPQNRKKEESDGQRQQPIRVFAPQTMTGPRLRHAAKENGTQRGQESPHAERDPEHLDVFSSLQSAVKNFGTPVLHPDHLVHRRARREPATRYLFVVDCSGSQAARQRMSALKGMVLALMRSSFRSGDEIVVIAFRGPRALVLVEPTKDLDLVERQLELVATGGRTPLAHALECASEYIDASIDSCLILLTDGRANVAAHGGDPWEESLEAAKKIRVPAVVIDTSTDNSGRAGELAVALNATCRRFDDVVGNAVVEVSRPDSMPIGGRAN